MPQRLPPRGSCHRSDGLLLECIILGLELVAPELGRFGHLPGPLQLLLGLLRTGFGLALQLPGFFLSGLGFVCTVFFLRDLQAQPVAVFGGAQLVGAGLVPFGFGLLGTFGQAVDVGVGGFQMRFCGIGAGFFGFELGQQLLHPLAVTGGCGELFGAARAGNQVQVLAGQLRQAF